MEARATYVLAVAMVACQSVKPPPPRPAPTASMKRQQRLRRSFVRDFPAIYTAGLRRATSTKGGPLRFVEAGRVNDAGRLLLERLKGAALEGLEPAQKQLMRMGPRNVSRVQEKLREIQRALGADAGG